MIVVVMAIYIYIEREGAGQWCVGRRFPDPLPRNPVSGFPDSGGIWILVSSFQIPKSGGIRFPGLGFPCGFIAC